MLFQSGFMPSFASSFAFALDDANLTAQVAYSTKRLRAVYAGSCLRVRRSSDNVEQDIGFAGNILDTAAMTSFVGANSAFITKWYDQSGNVNDAVQATAVNQPRIMNAGVIDTINTLPGIKFDGTNDYLLFTVLATPTDTTIYSVAERTATASVRTLFAQFVNNGSPAARYEIDHKVSLTVSGFSTLVTTALASPLGLNTIGSTHQANNNNVDYNGTNTNSATAGSYTIGNTMIGGDIASANSFEGFMCELIIAHSYNTSALTTLEARGKTYYGTP